MKHLNHFIKWQSALTLPYPTGKKVKMPYHEISIMKSVFSESCIKLRTLKLSSERLSSTKAKLFHVKHTYGTLACHNSQHCHLRAWPEDLFLSFPRFSGQAVEWHVQLKTRERQNGYSSHATPDQIQCNWFILQYFKFIIIFQITGIRTSCANSTLKMWKSCLKCDGELIFTMCKSIYYIDLTCYHVPKILCG